MAQYNLKNPAVKRLMKEAQELRESTDQYAAQPLDDNLFEWHFTVRGPEDSDFDGGIYHGRIVLPPEYPMKPPSILILTPNGRFELNKKICLSISGYHPESWQPSWSIRTALLAIIGFMPTRSDGAIGGLDYTSQERKSLARKSHKWCCDVCGEIKPLLKPPGMCGEKSEQQKRDENLAKQITFSKPSVKKEDRKESDKAESENLTKPTDADDADTNLTSNNPPCDNVIESSDGLRQRQATLTNSIQENSVLPPQENLQAPLTTPNHRNLIHRQHRQQQESTSLMLIIVLSTVLAILLLRRLDTIYDLRSSVKDLF